MGDIIILEQRDGYKTKIFTYPTDSEKVTGSLVIFHGMTEHHERYEPFIYFMNQNGFDVYAFDHRGHGIDKKIEDLGFFAEENGAELVISDATEVLKYVSENNRSDKLVLFAHSMGSIIARNVLMRFDKVDCAILSGTTFPSMVKSKLGYIYASLTVAFKGARKPGVKLNALLFDTKPYNSLCIRTKFDWLTRDHSIVGAYMHDAYCGFTCTNSFYRDLIRMTILAGTKKNIKKTRTDLPILFIAGDSDPVGGYGKEVEALAETYRTLGFEKISLTLYPECRHELLNELNKETIMNDILKFISENI